MITTLCHPPCLSIAIVKLLKQPTRSTQLHSESTSSASPGFLSLGYQSHLSTALLHHISWVLTQIRSNLFKSRSKNSSQTYLLVQLSDHQQLPCNNLCITQVDPDASVVMCLGMRPIAVTSKTRLPSRNTYPTIRKQEGKLRGCATGYEFILLSAEFQIFWHCPALLPLGGVSAGKTHFMTHFVISKGCFPWKNLFLDMFCKFQTVFLMETPKNYPGKINNGVITGNLDL